MTKLLAMTKTLFYAFVVQLTSITVLLAIDNSHGQSRAENLVDSIKYERLSDITLSLEPRKLTLLQALQELNEETGFRFTYSLSTIPGDQQIDLSAKEESLKQVLLSLSQQGNLIFRRVNERITVSMKEEEDKYRVKETISMDESIISGKVTDGSGDPLPGATVLVKGTTVGTITDAAGNYRLRMPTALNRSDRKSLTLVISFVGYQTQEIVVGERTVVDIVMQEDISSLEEIVVIGYGERRKDLLVSNVERLEGKEFEMQTNINADQAMQGRLPGVFVTNTSGAPGGNTQVVIRGLSSINAGNQPLYIIDGVPISVETFESAVSPSSQRFGNLNPLSLINPQDIASIEVLKDAAAKAIYGSRAANGAILITTKTGRGKEPTISFSTQQGIYRATRPYDVLTSAETQELMAEAYVNDGVEVPERIRNIDTSISTDWYDQIMREGSLQQYQISFSGSREDVNYYISAGHRREEGIIHNSGLANSTVRLNLEFNLKDNLRIGTRTNFGFDRGNQMYGGITLPSLTRILMFTTPFLPVRDENGMYSIPSLGEGSNPVAVIEEREHESKTRKLVTNSYFDWEIHPGISFRTDFSYDLNIFREDIFDTPNSATLRPERLPNGIRQHTFTEAEILTIEPRLTFTPDWQDHGLEVTLGSTILQQDIFNERLTGYNFANENTTYLNSAADILDNFSFQTGSGREGYSFFSIFSRLDYSYQEKYLLSATFRRDGSSRFGPDFRYGNFWSVGAGWVFSRETGMENVPWLSFGKLRASYGITGNDQVGNYPYIGYWEAGLGYLEQPTLRAAQLENADLKWEELADFDIGLELGFWDNRITVEGAYFNSESRDLLLQRPIGWTSGFSNFFDNIGDVRNRGLELDFSATVVRSGSFELQLGGNLTWAKNKIEALTNNVDTIEIFPYNALIVGQPINAFFMAQVEGMDPQTGDLIVTDINGDGQIAPWGVDRTITGNPNPRYYGGVNLGVKWKGISLDAQFSFVGRRDLFQSGLHSQWLSAYRNGYVAPDVVLDRWQQPGDQARFPRLSLTTPNNGQWDQFIVNGAFLRMRNLTLAYQIPQTLLSTLGVSNASFYFTGVNLLTFTNVEFADPEVGINGIQFGTYPQARQFVFGFNFQF